MYTIIHKLQSDTIIAKRIFILVGKSYRAALLLLYDDFMVIYNVMEFYENDYAVLGFVTTYRIFQESLILEVVFNLKVNVVDTPLQVNHL